MSPDNLGETTHRHRSPLAQPFPGDRARPDRSGPDDIAAGATAPPTARRVKSRTHELGPAEGVFRVGTGLGSPAAVTGTLPHFRRGRPALRPALPGAPAKSAPAQDAGARGGFVDLAGAEGRPAEARGRDEGGRTATAVHGGACGSVPVAPGARTALRGFAR